MWILWSIAFAKICDKMINMKKRQLFYQRSFILDSNIVNHWMHQIDIGIFILIRVYSIRKLTHGSNEKLWFNTVVTIHWHILSGLWTKQISKYTCTCNIPGLSCIIVCYTYIIKHLPQILNLAVNQRLMSSFELIFSSWLCSIGLPDVWSSKSEL